MAGDKKLFAPTLTAFTFLGSNARFSILGNGLTVYAPRTLSLSNDPVVLKFQKSYIHLCLQYWFYMPPIQPILHDHPAHDKYHQDAFDMEDTHMHLQFEPPLNEENLSEILEVFLQHGLIASVDEKENFINQYRMANRLTQTDVDANFARARLEEVKKSFAQFRTASEAIKQEIAAKLAIVISHFEQIIATNDHLQTAQEYLKEIQHVFDFPTPKNFQKLKTLGQQASYMSSILWRALGCALIVLGTALLATACLHMSFGLVSIMTGIAGLGLFRHGMSDLRHPYLKNNSLSEEIVALSETMQRPL